MGLNDVEKSSFANEHKWNAIYLAWEGILQVCNMALYHDLASDLKPTCKPLFGKSGNIVQK